MRRKKEDNKRTKRQLQMGSIENIAFIEAGEKKKRHKETHKERKDSKIDSTQARETLAHTTKEKITYRIYGAFGQNRKKQGCRLLHICRK